MKKINIESKRSELVPILNAQFQGKLNFSRIKLISLFVCTSCKVQTVGFEKLAYAFDTSSKPDSNVRRIQRFMVY